jgi:uncharacterized lipoprotein YmbA
VKTFSIIIALTVLLTACSSKTIETTNYYLLNNPTAKVEHDKIAFESSLDKQLVMVKVNELPDYLNQPNLVMQLSNHQLHYAHYHMWAEPLAIGISKTLTHALNTSDMANKIVFSNEKITVNTSATIIVNIESFQANHYATMLLTGYYKILPMESNERLERHGFTIELNLEQDGYLHSVEKMRLAIKKLANQISKNL